MKSESQRFYPKWLDPYLMLPKAQIIEFRDDNTGDACNNALAALEGHEL